MIGGGLARAGKGSYEGRKEAEAEEEGEENEKEKEAVRQTA